MLQSKLAAHGSINLLRKTYFKRPANYGWGLSCEIKLSKQLVPLRIFINCTAI